MILENIEVITDTSKKNETNETNETNTNSVVLYNDDDDGHDRETIV